MPNDGGNGAAAKKLGIQKRRHRRLPFTAWLAAFGIRRWGTLSLWNDTITIQEFSMLVVEFFVFGEKLQLVIEFVPLHSLVEETKVVPIAGLVRQVVNC
jgi:hypothetical protein